MKNLITLILLIIIVAACNVKPQKIYYGEDMCHYCSMTIVDRQHAAQLVTDKGKAYKFDAIECMVNHLAETTTPMKLYLVSDYSQPEILIDGKKATYIISPNIPSPMKANLSALSSQAEAESLQALKGGVLYTWDKLLAHLDNE